MRCRTWAVAPSDGEGICRLGELQSGTQIAIRSLRCPSDHSHICRPSAAHGPVLGDGLQAKLQPVPLYPGPTVNTLPETPTKPTKT